MSLEAFEKREQILELRSKVLQGEEQRLSGARTMSVSQARRALKERVNEI